jgi:uncharacterized protein (DUF2384 family)
VSEDREWIAGAGHDLGEVIEGLLDTYKPFGVGIFLVSPNRSLDGRRPIDLIAEGESARVLDLADRLAGGSR